MNRRSEVVIKAGILSSRVPDLVVVNGVAQQLTLEQISTLKGLGHRVQNLSDLPGDKIVAIAESQKGEINRRLKQESLNF